jgi:hypothetical protein
MFSEFVQIADGNCLGPAEGYKSRGPSSFV